MTADLIGNDSALRSAIAEAGNRVWVAFEDPSSADIGAHIVVGATRQLAPPPGFDGLGEDVAA